MTKEQVLLSEHLDFNMLFVLQNPDILLTDLRVNGWREVLKRKGYLNAYNEPTKKGCKMLELFDIHVSFTNTAVDENEESTVLSPFNTWVLDLQEAIRVKLHDAGKKPNLRGFGGVPFVPTITEIHRHLGMFWKEYPTYKDLDKIKSIMLMHVANCIDSDKFAPACKYFIYKRNHGTFLAGEYENWQEPVNTEESIRPRREDMF